jgi:hypothetical protein
MPLNDPADIAAPAATLQLQQQVRGAADKRERRMLSVSSPPTA